MRGWGEGKPFMLMECTPSHVNHHPVNMLKRPGVHKLASLQAVAHGSDSIQYFQFRKSRGSSEKFHGAVVDHCGHENTRVFRDVAEVGKILKDLGEIAGSVVNSDVALIVDWDNRWAITDAQCLNNAANANEVGKTNDPKKFAQTIIRHYKCFWELGINVDIISREADFSKYKTIVAPMLYMLPEKDGSRLADFVKKGGVLVTTYFSGVVNENDLVHLNGLPGAGLGEVLGIWAEEIDALSDDQYNLVSAFGKEYKTGQYCEIAHLRGAEVMGEYSTDFYAGMPALTKNKYGNGTAYYIAFESAFPDDDFLKKYYASLVSGHGIKRNLDLSIPAGVSVRKRSGSGYDYFFIQNFLDEPKVIDVADNALEDALSGNKVQSPLNLAGYGSVVLKRPKQ
jgi:beta-galactosidase